jgi:peptidoglycan hydrolase CwlO-like protein
VSWASEFVLLCSLPWFQVWAKSFITTNVTSTLTSFRQQLKTVQATTTEMHNQLAGHQTVIDQHQQELVRVQGRIRDAETGFINQQSLFTNQLQQIFTLQSELADTGANLSAQGKKLSEIEHWVKNLYGVTTNDTIRSQEANVPH